MEKEKQNIPIQTYYSIQDKPKKKKEQKDESMQLSDIIYDEMEKVPKEERAYREAKMKSFYEYQHAMRNKPIPEQYRNEPSKNGMEAIKNNQRAQMEVEQDIDYYRFLLDMHGDKSPQQIDELYDEYQQMVAEEKYTFEVEIPEDKSEDYEATHYNSEDLLQDFEDIRGEDEGREADDIER
jgi:hypothetical protein